jgi:hypothetical protein
MTVGTQHPFGLARSTRHMLSPQLYEVLAHAGPEQNPIQLWHQSRGWICGNRRVNYLTRDTAQVPITWVETTSAENLLTFYSPENPYGARR